MLELKSFKNWLNDIYGNIKALFLKLGTINAYYKKPNDTLNAIAMTTVLPMVLSYQKLKFPVFVLTKNHVPDTIYWWELRQQGIMSVPSRFFRLQFGGWKWWYFVFGQKEFGAKRVFMATTIRVSFDSHVMDIYGAKLQEHCFHISRDIVVCSVFKTFQLQHCDIITDLICIIEKNANISKTKRDM